MHTNFEWSPILATNKKILQNTRKHAWLGGHATQRVSVTSYEERRHPRKDAHSNALLRETMIFSLIPKKDDRPETLRSTNTHTILACRLIFF